MHHTLHFLDDPLYDVEFYHSRVTNDRARAWPPHVHDGLEIYVLEKGAVSFEIERKKYTLAPGDAVFSRPGEIHNCILEKDGVHCHFCFWFDTPLFRRLAELEGFAGERLIVLDAKAQTELLCTCAAIEEATLKEEKFLAFAATVRLLAILGQRARNKKKDLPLRLAEILEDISDTTAELDAVAKAHFISPSTLYRLFKDHLGLSPRAYREEKRLEKAKELLRKGESVADAARGAGFVNCSSFIRTFRQRVGVTPAVYSRFARDGSASRLYTDIRWLEE